MALIKCSECGQMVSDKATACPHCGCPVKRQLVCPECGETVSEGDSYCLKCGCPLNQNAQPQVEEQVDYSWGDEEEKPNNTLRWLLGVLAVLVLLGGAALYVCQSGMFNKTVPLEDTVAVDSTPQMLAPIINLNANGMYTIDDCPTAYDGLEIIRNYTSNGCLMSIVVNREGEYFQTINTNTSFEDFKDIVHFLDANFDGFVDFMIGSGNCEENSILLLWSPEESKFETASIQDETVISGLGNYGFSFNPQTQKVYCSGNMVDVDVEKKCQMIWQNNSLINEEELMEIFNKSKLSDYNYKNCYTLIKTSTNKVLVSTDDPNELPERWKKVAHILTPEEKAEFAEADAQVSSPEESYTADDDSDIEEVKSWIQGNWRYRMVSELGAMECRVGINGDYIVVMYNGEVQYSGPYTIEGDNIIYKRGKGWTEGIMIDRVHKRLMATESEPMRRM